MGESLTFSGLQFLNLQNVWIGQDKCFSNKIWQLPAKQSCPAAGDKCGVQSPVRVPLLFAQQVTSDLPPLWFHEGQFVNKAADEMKTSLSAVLSGFYRHCLCTALMWLSVGT